MAFEWKDVGKIAGSMAPIVGTLLGGPAGAALGGLLASALGTENTPDAVHAAIAADPAAALKIAEFESENKVKLQALVFAHADKVIDLQAAEYNADTADRGSARAREIAVKDHTPAVLASVTVGASIILGGLIVAGFGAKDPVQAALAGTVIGYIFGEAKQVLAYYFGNSASTVRVTDQLANSTPVIPTP